MSSSLTELARYGFSDLTSTMPKLDQLVGLVGDSGRSALASLAKSANPDQALNALLDYAQADKKAIKRLLAKVDSADRLCITLGSSSALVDFIRRRPEQLELFEKPVVKLLEQAELTELVRKAVMPAIAQFIKSPAEYGSEACWNILRLTYRSELLKIAIFDVTNPKPQDALPVVAASLADLAGAAIEAAIDIARAELSHTKDFGNFTAAEVAATNFAVIAMGKCGARELNYISDVDVIFVGEPANETIDNQRAIEVSTKLATRTMRAIDGNAKEPMLWQVDPNLRPEGKSGALVRTLESHVAYYDRWAESWEFQALLKARHLAGSKELGDAYVSALNPKVWESSKRENFVENAQKMRQRVLEFIPVNEVDREIKLGPGGLRDIEFTVQLLQLVHGRADETVHQRDTLSALAALVAAGYVSREDAAIFDKQYRYLRFLEHRIQLSELRRTHLMPTSELALRSLARSVDLKMTADSLVEQWEGVKGEVRGLHQKLFYRPLLSAVAKLDTGLALSDEQAVDRLQAIGFSDAKGALGHIRALTGGLSRRAAIQKNLLPILLEWFGKGTDPDAALLAFRTLSEALGDSPWFLRMLRDSSGAAERMTQVLSNSKLATSLFAKIPEAAAWFDKPEDLVPITAEELATEVTALLERHQTIEPAAAAMRFMRRRETLRLAMAAIVGELTIEQLGEAMTAITESYLVGVLDAVLSLSPDKVGDRRLANCVDFAVVAMGRFGGEELGFGSDADVMFVHQAQQGVEPQVAQKAAEKIVSLVRQYSQDTLLEFELDLDLRPEGKQGPTVRSLDSYRAYYERWGAIWENQALLRARTIAGSQALRSAFDALANQYRYPAEISAANIQEIRRIKARVETERLPQGADPKRHLKLGRGSLSDVEWAVQLMQLIHGAKHPSIRTSHTLEALEECVKADLIASHDAKVLEAAWLLASRVRAASVLWANKRTDVLPADRKQLEGMARILEYPAFSATTLEQDYLAATRRARLVFERVFYGYSTED